MPFRPKNSRFWHYDFQIQGRRFHGTCDTEDFETAKGVEAQARVEARSAAARADDAAGVFTISEAIGTYYADICQHQSSARTSLSQGKAIVSTMDPAMTLDAMSNADLLGYISRRRANVANATANRELQFLSRAVKHMQKFHAAAVAPLDFKAPEVKEPEERTRELTWDEQAALFQHLRADLHPFVKFALMTGARRATICGMRWRDVDLNTARLRFRVKGEKTRFFPINGELRAFLSALPRANAPGAASYVFTYVNEQTLERLPISPAGGGVHEDFHKAVVKAGIEDFRFHDLRHTFATRMLRKTGNLKLVSRLLGHSSIESTVRYAHVLDDDLHNAMADFSALSLPISRQNKA
jgi:integrase